jgi:hypothetical protein
MKRTALSTSSLSGSDTVLLPQAARGVGGCPASQPAIQVCTVKLIPAKVVRILAPGALTCHLTRCFAFLLSLFPHLPGHHLEQCHTMVLSVLPTLSTGGFHAARSCRPGKQATLPLGLHALGPCLRDDASPFPTLPRKHASTEGPGHPSA